ncbi:acyl-CoA synthetase [Lentzea sp. NPDC051213]|uniref:acyl-CoA synthetase n=1 Tax=Lentzea sp. NPDC051213 TaxID=3364126 RepID=UPI00378868D0
MALNIADLFEHSVDLVPDRTAVLCGERRLTYRALEERANRLAHHLARHGVGPGSHVGVYLRNRAETLETMLAVYKLRAVAININYRYVREELRYVFDNADLVALVHERQTSDVVAEVLPDVPGLRHVVVVDDDYETVLAAEHPERDFPERSADDLYVVYTGGTTGKPKGVMWRHEDIWRVLGGGIDFYSGEPVADEWQQARQGAQGEPVTWFTMPPLIHAAAQWPALVALFGGHTVLLTPRFDPVEAWRLIERHGVAIAVITGDAMARPLVDALRDGDFDTSSLVAMGSGAALFSSSVKQQCLDALPNVVITDSVGSSETGFSGIGIVEPGAAVAPRVRPGKETVVLDERGRPVVPGSGVAGRLARTGHLPLGYYKDPDRTAEMFIEVDGRRYVTPGDRALVEADGTITLLGRGNTCINTGGEKVFPEEVEGTLKAHPDVFDAIVIGVEDDRTGQRVAAIVQLRPGYTPDVPRIDAYARTRLAGYKVPRSYWFADEVGRTPSGKPDYGWALRYAQEHEHA